MGFRLVSVVVTIAFTPDMHWAMDRHLIAPGPDLRALCDLEGRELLLPTEPRLYPKQDALASRLGS